MGLQSAPSQWGSEIGGSALARAQLTCFTEGGSLCPGGPGTSRCRGGAGRLPARFLALHTPSAHRGVHGVTEMPAPLMRPGAAPLSCPARISSCLSPALIEFSPLQLILMDFLVPPRGPVLPN